MQNLDLITNIAAAGSMGVSIYCVIKVFTLLKNEQERDIVRPEFIKTIYVFMAFGIFMTAFSLLIEYVRPLIQSKDKENLSVLKNKLKTIANTNFYSVDEKGNPQNIELIFLDTTYILGKPLANDVFKSTELKFKVEDQNENNLLINKRNQEEFIFGLVTNDELKMRIENDLELKDKDDLFLVVQAYNDKELDLKNIRVFNAYDAKKVAKNILYLLQNKDELSDTQENDLLKISTESLIMNQFKEDEYDIISDVLSTRQRPFKFWRLSQLYYNKYLRFHKEKDKETYERYYQDYIGDFEKNQIKYQSYQSYKSLKDWYCNSSKNMNHIPIITCP